MGTDPTPGWYRKALCKGQTELFYTDEPGRPSSVRLAVPLAVCAACPVKEDCLTDALARREPYGIWGGTTPRQRSRMLGVDLSTIRDLSSETWRRYGRKADG